MNVVVRRNEYHPTSRLDMQRCWLWLLVWAGVNRHRGQDDAFVFRIVNKPIEVVLWLAQQAFGLSDESTAVMGWFCLAIYWMAIGGLIGWGVSVLRSKTP